MKKLSLLGSLLFSFSLTGCGQKAFDRQLALLYRQTVPLVQPAQLAKELKQKQPLLMLDIRSEAEYAVSHLPGAALVDYQTFTLKDVSNIPKDAPVVVYCAVGVRSERVGEQLQRAGYTNVRNLYGGILQWKNAGRPVVRAQNIPTERVHTYNRYWGVWLTNGVKVHD